MILGSFDYSDYKRYDTGGSGYQDAGASNQIALNAPNTLIVMVQKQTMTCDETCNTCMKYWRRTQYRRRYVLYKVTYAVPLEYIQKHGSTSLLLILASGLTSKNKCIASSSSSTGPTAKTKCTRRRCRRFPKDRLLLRRPI
jgi:hypothetical protein